MTRLPAYADFPEIARRSSWEPDGIDLASDAAAWPRLQSAERTAITGLLAGFLIGERCVARDIRPFHEQSPSAEVAACFAAQARDEERHQRFFERVHREVLGEELEVALAAAGRRVPTALIDLFERELAAAVARLGGDDQALVPAVALYHGVLEGVVFLAGQAELLTRLADCGRLPGVAHGVGRVQRDERWHVAFGARLLADAGADGDRLAAEAGRAVAAWGGLLSAREARQVLEGVDRRLRAVGLPVTA